MSVAQIVAPPVAGFLIEQKLMLAWAGVAGFAAFVGLMLNLRQESAAAERA